MSNNQVTPLKHKLNEAEAMKSEVQRFRKEVSALQAELTRASVEVDFLKKEVEHKQNVCTRLLAQRNSARFLHDKIAGGLKNVLKASQCKIGKDATIHDLFETAAQIVLDAASKVVPLTTERNELREELAATRETLMGVEIQLKELTAPLGKSVNPNDDWSSEDELGDYALPNSPVKKKAEDTWQRVDMAKGAPSVFPSSSTPRELRRSSAKRKMEEPPSPANDTKEIIKELESLRGQLSDMWASTDSSPSPYLSPKPDERKYYKPWVVKRNSDG